MATFLRIMCFILFRVLGLVQSKGSNRISYRAVRYGSYYSSKYFSYSGGKGYARYSRVYKDKTNLYPALYNYMFSWFQTEDFKVYKNTPSGYISVCKNYEADENGTYLGIFTCPLPFVPESHAYCCGATNAQYCCKFWDIPINVAAVSLAALMGVILVILFIHIGIQICINRHRAKKEKQKLLSLRKIGMMKMLGRQPSMKSIPLWKYFDDVHSESNYREGGTLTEEDEYSDTEASETRSSVVPINNNTNVEKNDNSIWINTDNRSGYQFSETETNAIANDRNETCLQHNDTEVEHAHSKHGIQNKAFTDIDNTYNKINGKQFQPSLKPLRKTSRVNFNGSYNPTVSLWYSTQNSGPAK